jgi:glucose-6-phosphate isomerase
MTGWVARLGVSGPGRYDDVSHDPTGEAHRPGYVQETERCFDRRIGPHGLSADDIWLRLDRLNQPILDLAETVRAGTMEHFSILDRDDDIVAAEAALAKLSRGAQTIVFFGTGGSGLGGQTLAQLAGWNIPGGADAAQRSRPRTRFYDNLDPVTLSGALDSLDLASTRFVVISKSGGTAETLSQMVATLAAIRTAGLETRIGEMFLAVSDPVAPGGRNALRQFCAELRIPVLDHPPGIGGRFSGLSVVGLLPAMARGLDVRAVRRGARSVLLPLIKGKLAADSPASWFAPAIGAAVAVALAEARAIKVNVMMPYADRLQRFGAWYVQLWAESLGKSGNGTAPVACLGPVDQHSQLQLFMDGPREHFVTLVTVPTQGTGPVLPADLAQRAGLSYLGGRRVGDLVAAQAEAVADALTQAGRPVRIIRLAQLDEHALGALLMHMMLETILAGRLLGVDPFDQPAVELAKVLTRERLAAKA